MRRSLVLPAALAVLVAGCGGKTHDLRGSYEGGLKAISADRRYPEFGGIAHLYSLQISDSTHYTMKIGYPITGHYTVRDNHVTFTPETISGVAVDQWRRRYANQPASDHALPIEATLDPGDGSLVLDANNEVDGWATVFRKHVVIDEAKRSSTVRPEEAKLVGTYKGSLSLGSKPQTKLSPGTELLFVVTLDLSKDNSFRLHERIDLDGTWRLDGDRLVLTAVSEAGIFVKDLPGEGDLQIEVRRAKDGKSLTFDDPMGLGKVTLTR